VLLEPDPDSCINVDPTCDPDPVFPQLYRPWDKEENSQIFDDFMTYDDLYQKPVFGDCIWAVEDEPDQGCFGK
jgi:hypothetical protein